MCILPFWAMFLMKRRGYDYTIAVDFYAFRLAFSAILYGILHHFTLHLAPKRIAFSTKTHCVLHHIAMILATNSPKMGANGDFLK